MNYFELFGLPVSLKVDTNEIRKKYFELSRKHHPDYFINEPEAEQQNALEVSALLNKALETFSTPDKTIGYVLQLKNLIADEEKYQLPPAFLMEMMDINEELAEMELGDSKKGELDKKLSDLEKGLYAPVKKIIENYSEEITTPEELLQVKEYYFKKKYLQRLHQQLSQKL